MENKGFRVITAPENFHDSLKSLTLDAKLNAMENESNKYATWDAEEILAIVVTAGIELFGVTAKAKHKPPTIVPTSAELN